VKNLNYKLIFYDVLVGTLFVLFNFNGFLRFASKNWIANPTVSKVLVDISHWPDFIVPAQKQASLALYGNLLNVCFWGLWIYLVAILLLALVRLRPQIVSNGLLGLFAGLFSIAIFSWLEVIITGIVNLLITITVFIAGVLAAVWNFLAPFIGWLVIIVGIVAVLGAIGWGVYELWKKIGPWGFVGAFVAGGLLYLIWPSVVKFYQSVILPVLQWIGAILTSILNFLAPIFVWLFKAIIIIAIILSALGLFIGFVGSAGHMLIDQIKAAWHSGSGQRGILLGSFAVGLSLVLIFWVSSGSAEMTQIVNSSWTSTAFLFGHTSPVQVLNSLLPASVVVAEPNMFQTATAPVFDSITLLVVLAVSYLGIMRGLRPKQEDTFQTMFVSRDLLKLGGALVLALPAVALVLLAAAAPKED
jgi:hypothetical protein